MENENLGSPVGTVIRWFKSDGTEIGSNPSYRGRLKPYNEKPDDYVEIEQTNYKKWLPSPNGEPMETFSLGKPKKEVYYRWIWADSYWDSTVCLVIENGIIGSKMDRRPNGWNFLQEFQAHKARLNLI